MLSYQLAQSAAFEIIYMSEQNKYPDQNTRGYGNVVMDCVSRSGVRVCAREPEILYGVDNG